MVSHITKSATIQAQMNLIQGPAIGIGVFFLIIHIFIIESNFDINLQFYHLNALIFK